MRGRWRQAIPRLFARSSAVKSKNSSLRSSEVPLGSRSFRQITVTARSTCLVWVDAPGKGCSLVSLETSIATANHVVPTSSSSSDRRGGKYLIFSLAEEEFGV